MAVTDAEPGASDQSRLQDVRPEVEVVVADTIAGVEAMRESWQAADVRDIDSDIDYFLTVVRHSVSVIRPYVVRIRRRGRADVFGIARLEEYPVRLAVGYCTVAKPVLKAVVVTFGGLVGADAPHDFELLLDELRRPLRSGEAEALVIRGLPRDGSQYELARRKAGVWRVRGTSVAHRWTADPPTSLDEFLTAHSGKGRASIRRQERLLVRKYGESLELKRFTDVSQSRDLLHDLETIAARTYQRGLGVGYQTSRLTEALTELGLRRGLLCAWMLYVGGVPVAYWTGWRYAGTLGSGTTGYDPAYAKDAVGRYTMHRMIEDIALDGGIRRIDLGHGDLEYKKTFRPRRTPEVDVIIVGPAPRAVAIGLGISVHARFNTLGKAMAARSSVARRLIRSWRGRLSASGT